MIARLMGLKTLSPARLYQRMQGEPGIVMIDVNAPPRWAQAHVPGALNLDPAGFGAADLPADKNAMLVFYCSNFMCRKAPNAAKRAEKMGHTNVHVLSAGIAGWLAAALPTEAAMHSV